MTQALAVVSVVLLVGVVGLLLVLILRSRGSKVDSGLDRLGQGQERGERLLREEMARSREEVERGDEVVLIGKMGEEEIPVSELADRTDRIPYEITLAIGRRVPRVYTRSQRALWARTMLGSRSFEG